MLITVSGVKQEVAPKGYKIAHVTFLRDGKEETRKIMSFASKEVFAKLVELKEFPVEVNVVLNKNEKTGYWDWVDMEKQATGAKNDGAGRSQQGGRVLGSNYETPEERAKRQVYIIRQSSIASAIEMAKAVEPKGITKSRSDILEDAKAFEAFVLDIPNFGDAEVK